MTTPPTIPAWITQPEKEAGFACSRMPDWDAYVDAIKECEFEDAAGILEKRLIEAIKAVHEKCAQLIKERKRHLLRLEEFANRAGERLIKPRKLPPGLTAIEFSRELLIQAEARAEAAEAECERLRKENEALGYEAMGEDK